MSYKKLFNDMTWSFSRAHSYEICPYYTYLKYIENREGEQNYFAANGKAMHEIFEEILTHKITLEEAPALYEEKYDLIYEKTKQSTMDKTFEKCIDYLCTVEPIDENKYEIMGVELELHFKVGKYKFIGFADLVLRDRESGQVILIDHKSSDHFMKKDGTPLKNQLENFIAYKKQMYLYCKGIKDSLGLDVTKIVWHHFKDNGELTIIPFLEEEYQETIDWAINTIETIKKDKEFNCNKTYMYCRQLCDYRYKCEYKEEGD